MRGLKYLSDGRKVSFIGKINQTEYIVQEIFITESGDEIPSGENFTTKTLHDTPAQSYKEREAVKLEQKLVNLKSEITALTNSVKELTVQRKAYSAILRQNQKFVDLFNESEVDYLSDVLTGNVKYCVSSSSYDWYKPCTLDKGLINSSNSYGTLKYNGLCMMKVFALTDSDYLSDRRCRVRINDYADGSGNDKEYIFFKTREDLEKYLQDAFLEKYHSESGVSLSVIKELQEWIDIDEDIIAEIKNKERLNILKRQEDLINSTKERTKKELDALDSK